ncbi:MAG: pyridoxine 5'-phosphate synthase [Saprospiraceae bacterium]|nr:pyridoxine 5'-phosphate synthase [Saprospiraceae bacterium]
MTRLSVNINKVATLRNARGGNIPNLIQVAKDCERFGAEGITVHPRPDERHIRYQDVRDLQSVVQTEFNIEGYPNEKWLELVESARPAQATLVPDKPGALTSNAGWDTIAEAPTLAPIIQRLKKQGIRTSIFVDADPKMVEGAAQLDADRVELYTGPYAEGYSNHAEQAISPYRLAAEKAAEVGLGLNAGHDLDLNNLTYFAKHIPNLLEVSIGHALISDALYFGLENTIQLYLRCLKQ